MAATNNIYAYGTRTAVNISAASDTYAGSAVESAVVDTTGLTYRPFDILIDWTFSLAAQTIVGGNAVNLWAAGSPTGANWPVIQQSGGATYQTGAQNGSTSTEITLPVSGPSALGLLDSYALVAATIASSTTFKSTARSIAALFGGVVPQKFSFIMDFQTAGNASASGGTAYFDIGWTPVWTQSGVA